MAERLLDITELDVLDPAGRLSSSQRAWLDDAARRALTHLGVRGRVGVRVVGDAEMAEAHRRYGHVDGTTDVLTFDLRETPGAGDQGSAGDQGPERSGLIDADLLICHDEAARQGRALGHPAERELLLYVVHGVLHCLGEDDREDDAARAMHAREDAVLSAIGVGPVYAARRDAAETADAARGTAEVPA